ncbi:hypothetical protein ACIQOW_03550 [Kitasatospora sp. NPDC091335]|uniref:hypothetical protein n=1 Tax=Kitasatospora sp. NPDC091335 TaxID=3364085 RepID=UPI0037F5D0FB
MAKRTITDDAGTREECTHCIYGWDEHTAEDAERHPEWDAPVGYPWCCPTAQAEFRAGVA